ncbi:TPA: hypothetical protein TX084_000793 [Streptococcus suis]|nr:hypothetical protein [Streptococcus suis]
MHPQKINNELTYQVTMIQARQLLQRGIITLEEFEQFQTSMIEKYQPFISKLSC